MVSDMILNTYIITRREGCGEVGPDGDGGCCSARKNAHARRCKLLTVPAKRWPKTSSPCAGSPVASPAIWEHGRRKPVLRPGWPAASG